MSATKKGDFEKSPISSYLKSLSGELFFDGGLFLCADRFDVITKVMEIMREIK
jgi:hypothetical protein